MADFSLKAVFGLDATGVKSEIKQLRKEFNSFVEDYAKLGVGIAVGAFVALSKGAIDLAGRLSDTSVNIGINVESLQALEAQHKRNGVAEEQLGVALSKLRVSSQEAATGNEKLANAFAVLGINANEIARLPLEQKYEAVARGMKNASNQQEAYNAVGEIFGGKVGPKLQASLLELAESGFPKVAKEAREAGHIMSAETIVALDKAGDAIDDFKKKATIAVGNIIVNFRSEEGLKLLGMQFMKVLGTFGAGIVDAINEGGQLVWAVFKGAFIGTINIFRDGFLDMVMFIGEELNNLIPEWLQERGFKFNVQSLEELKSAGTGISDEITLAIAQTSPGTFKKDVAAYWDKAIGDQQKVVDKMNKIDFGPEAKKLINAGERIEGGMKTGADGVKEAAKEASKDLVEASKAIAVNMGRRGVEYDQQSTAALQGAIQRYKDEIARSNIDPTQSYYTTRGEKVNMSAEFFASELAAAQAELNARQQAASYANRYGEEAARAKFGDAVTDRALRDLKTSSDRTAVAVEKLVGGLSSRGIIPRI